MIDRRCPRCGRSDKSEVIDIVAEKRIYTFRCGHCGDGFTVSGQGDEKVQTPIDKRS